mmetsp:Transcript_135852/g.378596  ORF Transcript_135852/g.378596 Transcript_135852/m.378596 type:complete len:225 (+) Transcript_135852:548-1222(+)
MAAGRWYASVCRAAGSFWKSLNFSRCFCLSSSRPSTAFWCCCSCLERLSKSNALRTGFFLTSAPLASAVDAPRLPTSVYWAFCTSLTASSWLACSSRRFSISSRRAKLCGFCAALALDRGAVCAAASSVAGTTAGTADVSASSSWLAKMHWSSSTTSSICSRLASLGHEYVVPESSKPSASSNETAAWLLQILSWTMRLSFFRVRYFGSAGLRTMFASTLDRVS